MTSYKILIDKIEAFYDTHLQVKKFGSDFLEQLPNFATKNEKYPIVYVSPVSGGFADYTKTLTVEVRCLDIIQKDRANINTILSDTHLILNDLLLHLNLGDDATFDVVSSSVTPLNNDLLDYAAGWLLTLEVVSDSYCVEDIPTT